MKILYAIQGTGNKHLARSTEIIPLLKEMAETDVLVSGIKGVLKVPIKGDYQCYGMSFIFGKKGGISIMQTLVRSKPLRLIRDICKLPVKQYDLVLSDFEPVSAWACKLKATKCVGISHQNAVLHPETPKPKQPAGLGQFILKHYAPTNPRYGFHFEVLDFANFTPVIRSSIRAITPTDTGHYTVYLPAYSDEEIIQALSPHQNVKWEVFTKHSKKEYKKNNITFQPVSLEHFTRSFTSCRGILCTAGFETPSEAIFMGKKLCVIPMKNQYEQACNAAFLESMGVPVLSGLRNSKEELKQWLETNHVLQVDYPDETKEILRSILASA